MIARILTWLAVLAIGAAVVYGIVAGYEVWRDGKVEEGDAAGYGRCKTEWGDANTKQADQVLQEVAKARAEERQIAADAAKGERDARARAEETAQRNAAAARNSASAAGSLRDGLAALDAAAIAAGVPSAASCAGQFAEQRDAAIRARGLFGACVAEYRQLAQDADGTVAGLELQLATALSWIHAATGASGAPQ